MTRQMLVLELCCPQCGAALTEGTRVRLYGHVRRTHQQGEVSLSAVFGDYSVEADLTLEEGDVVDLSCPKCEASVMLPLACKICGATHGVAQPCQGRLPGVLLPARLQGPRLRGHRRHRRHDEPDEPHVRDAL